MKKIFFISIALICMGTMQAQNVGIGVPSPQIKLDANLNAIIGTSATLGNQHDEANRGTKVSFGATVAGDTTEFAGMRVTVNPGFILGNSGDILFNTWLWNEAVSREVMRINGRGYVGIGTAGPTANLHISNTTSDAILRIQNLGNTNGARIEFDKSSGQYNAGIGYYSDNADLHLRTLEENSLVFEPHNVEAMRIDAAGKVGIGTSAPSAKLQVTGNVLFSAGAITLDSSLDASQGNIGMGDLPFGNAKLGVSSNQDYGVFIYAPDAGQYALGVVGEAAKPGSATWVVVSDERLKNNVKPYSDGLAQLLQIKPVSFHYNQESGYNTKKEYVGVIAQQLQQVAPYMVGKFNRMSDKKEFLNVDNNAMTYMLINAVKEQQTQIEALKAANEKLAAENLDFKTMIERRLKAIEVKN